MSRPNLRECIDQVIHHLDNFLKGSPGRYGPVGEIHQAMICCRTAQLLLAETLPGVEVSLAKQPKFRRPLLEEVKLFCDKAGICARDAEWFWHHMEGKAWTNGNKKVASWEKTLIAWRLAGYLPSLKDRANTAPLRASRDRALRELDQLDRRIKI